MVIESMVIAAKDFYHFCGNVYVLIIPKDGSKTIEDKRSTSKAIENLFEPEVLTRKVKGKDFNRNKNIDAKREYRKSVFASEVVRKGQQSINFSGFKEVFDRLRLTIDDDRKNKAE